jgi:hypothetical protein
MGKRVEPRINVEQISVKRSTDPGLWHVGWRIRNLGEKPLEILTARLPHSQFRGAEQALEPASALPPNESALLELSVVCSESPGAIVENAFLILRVLWQERPWLILARMRVEFGDESAPRTTTELITTQEVGFSARKMEG